MRSTARSKPFRSGVMRCPGVLDLLDALEASDTSVSAGRGLELKRDRCQMSSIERQLSGS